MKAGDVGTKPKKVKWGRGDSISVLGVEGKCLYLQKAQTSAKNCSFARIPKPNNMLDVVPESYIKPWA
jgi:hypothetical protein